MELTTLKGLDNTINAYKKTTITTVIASLVLMVLVSVYAINKSETKFVYLNTDGSIKNLDEEAKKKAQVEILVNNLFVFDRYTYNQKFTKATQLCDDLSSKTLKKVFEQDLKVPNALGMGYIFNAVVDSVNVPQKGITTVYATQSVWSDGKTDLKQIIFQVDFHKTVSSDKNLLGLTLTNFNLIQYLKR